MISRVKNIEMFNIRITLKFLSSILIFTFITNAGKQDSSSYTLKYKATLTCDKHVFEKDLLKRRLLPFGNVTFPKIDNGSCKTEIVLNLNNKPSEKRIKEIEGFLTSSGKFGIHLLAKPDEVVLILDRINAAITLSNPSLKISRFEDLLLPTFEQIGVEEKNIKLVDSLLNLPAVINSLKNDTVDYRIWWALNLTEIGPNFGSSNNIEKVIKIKELYFLKKNNIFNNNQISNIKFSRDQKDIDFIRIYLNNKGKELLSELTGKHVNQFAIVTMDSTVLSCLRIFQKYSNGVIDIDNLEIPTYQYFGQMMIVGELKNPLLLCK